jgi:NADH dehydrogenase [ubiquinone] 1 alpha subcomplex assembly factor 5
MRIACAVGEQEREGGLSARCSPLAQVRDAGNLLGRAGLTLPAVDTDTLTIQYQSGARRVAVRNAAASRLTRTP